MGATTTHEGESVFLRTDAPKTLDDVREALDDKAETITCINTQVVLDLTADDGPKVGFGDTTKFEVPATETTISALGTWLDVPSKFLNRLDADMQQHLLTGLLRQNPGTMLIRFNDDDGIVEVRDPSTRVIDPRRLVDVASKVVSPEVQVTDFWNGDDFRLDVVVPEGFDRGIGGDPQVGDITQGGIRLFQDRKHNLAPGVSPFFRRLVCTNGMEMMDEGLRVDARGQSVEQVLAEFEAAAERAFSRVEADMEAFYELRTQRVANPERAILRLAEEHGLPDRTAVRLAQRVPAYVQDDGTASMFDLVNLITNQANDPSIRGRSGVRRNLESVGGNIVVAHAERCGHCLSKLAS